jgi:hypothetical protein
VRRAIQPDRYLSPVPQHDSVLGALAAVKSYSIQDAKYFSGLEMAYRSAISEVSCLRQQVHNMERPVRLVVADWLRPRPFLYHTARRLARVAKLI